MTPQHQTFDGMGLAPDVRDVLLRLKFTVPTPIQSQSIPIAIEGKDVVGIAQTGTGKTLAFGIPMIQQIKSKNTKGLVLVPTRELALQVEESLRAVGTPLGIKTAVLIGGAPMHAQVGSLRRGPDIVIATPGRLIDHLEHKTVRLGEVGILVLDEADRMLDMGFLPQIRKVLAAVPKDRQTMLFSATLAGEVMSIASTHMKLPIRIEIAPQGTAAEHVTQEIIVVPKQSKLQLLEKVVGEYHGPTLVFSRTKFGAKRIARSLRAMGHTAAEIHSNRSLNQRREALEGFKSGKYRLLVATDIAARGIDVSGIELVVNFDLPSQTTDYVHRIGRTGRAGREGSAISFALPHERNDVRSIERLIKKPLRISHVPTDLPPARSIASGDDSPDAPRHFRYARRTSARPHAFQRRGQGKPNRRSRPPFRGAR